MAKRQEIITKILKTVKNYNEEMLRLEKEREHNQKSYLLKPNYYHPFILIGTF